MDISVIIPIYNVEEFLVDCLESVRQNVTGLDAEVILIDDGSSDNSPVIAQLYAERLEQFTYYHTENGGLSRARNYGVMLAKGKYLYFVDADDLLTDGILRKMLETAERNGTELTVCNVARYKDKKIQESFLHLHAFHGLREAVSHVTKHPELIYDSTSWNKLILRSFFIKSGITFPEGFTYEDMLPNFAMHFCCTGVSIVRDTGYLWRVRTGSNRQITQVNNKKTLADKMEMMAATLTYARTHAAGPGIMEALETKLLTYDFDSWLDQLRLVPEDEAEEYVALIRGFVDQYIDKEYIGKVPIFKQQVYHDILQSDMIHLLKVINYKNSNYSRAPVVDKNDGQEILLPDDIFTIKNRNAVHEFGNYILPISVIDSAALTGNVVSLAGLLYINRVNVPFQDEGYFKAVLLNENTGSVFPLPVTPVERKDVTTAKGNILNYDDYNYYRYDYDGAGFKIDVDFNEIAKRSEMQGINYIVISYDFKYNSGNWLLKGITGLAKKNAGKFAYEENECRGNITFDVQNIIRIVLGNSREELLSPSGNNIAQEILPVFFSTMAGKQLAKLQKDNKKLKKEKEKIQKEKILIQKEKIKIQKELSSIKVSRGFKVLNRYYHVRDSIRKGFTGFLSGRETALEKGIPSTKRITTSDRRVTLINYWTADPVICNQDWLYRFIKNNTDIKHLNVFSLFGKKEYVEKYATKKDVFFSGENLDVRHGLYDEYCDYCLDYVGLSLGFAQRKEANYLRLPLWMVWIFDPVIDKDKIAERVRFINHTRNTGKYECTVIARHDKWNMRTPIYEALKDKITVLCAGKWNNNTRILWDEYKDNKIRFLQDCKFTICAENEDTPWYVTEKLFEAFLGGCIPIYAGAHAKPEPGIINPDAVLLWERGNRENNETVIKKVCELNQNRELYEEFLSRKKLLPGTVDYVYDRFVLLKEKLSELQ